MHRQRGDRRFLIALTADGHHDAIATDRQHRFVPALALVGLPQPVDQLLGLGCLPVPRDDGRHLSSDLAEDLVRPFKRVLLQEQTQDDPLGMLGDQATDAVGQGRSGPAIDQAEQLLEGEQAAFAAFAGLVQPAAQAERTEGGIDGGGGLVAAAVACAANTDLIGDILGLIGLQGLEGRLEGLPAQGAGQSCQSGFEVLGGFGGDGLGAEVEQDLGQLAQDGQEGRQHSELLCGQEDCRTGGISSTVAHGGVLEAVLGSVNTPRIGSQRRLCHCLAAAHPTSGGRLFPLPGFPRLASG
jgi:hypothetical protein